jgi:inner membrane protein
MTADGPAASQPPISYAWTSSPAAKAGMILVLLLLMQIPLYMVSNLIDERQGRQEDVQADFRRSWGPAQVFSGPILAVPYEKWVRGDKPADTWRTERQWVRIPASQLSITATLVPETRRRGLFHAVVYTAALGFHGTITVPRIDVADDLLWKEAVLVTTATDLRGQPADNKSEVDGHAVNQAILTTKGACGGIAVAPAPFADRPAAGTVIPFRSSLVLRGTQSLSLLPYGQQIDLQLSAPWDTPSFTGSMLPLTYGIDHAGFHANWQIAGDAVSGNWHTALSPSPFCSGIGANDDAQMGVDLLERVPTYLMVSRAAKYGTLFLALSFLTYFIFEAVSRVRIHLAQYALLGLSVSLFALLLVALAEPLGFTVGYVLSTGAVMAQASLYTLSIVGSARLATMFAGVLGLLFGFLYVVLSLETFSLLAGTVALFGALSAIMVMTRRLDWGARATASNEPVS